MYHSPAGPPRLKWSSLLLREDSQGTRAAISRRLDSIEKSIRGHVPSPDEIVQKWDDLLGSTKWPGYKVHSSLKTTIQTTLLLLIHASIKTGKMDWLENESLRYRLQLLDVDLPFSSKEDAWQLQHEIYASTIEYLDRLLSPKGTRIPSSWRNPLSP